MYLKHFKKKTFSTKQIQTELNLFFIKCINILNKPYSYEIEVKLLLYMKQHLGFRNNLALN